MEASLQKKCNIFLKSFSILIGYIQQKLNKISNDNKGKYLFKCYLLIAIISLNILIRSVLYRVNLYIHHYSYILRLIKCLICN